MKIWLVYNSNHSHVIVHVIKALTMGHARGVIAQIEEIDSKDINDWTFDEFTITDGYCGSSNIMQIFHD